MSNQGPSVDVVGLRLTCVRCVYSHVECERTGKNPQYTWFCSHPKMVVGWIGYNGTTPRDCPILLERKERK